MWGTLQPMRSGRSECVFSWSRCVLSLCARVSIPPGVLVLSLLHHNTCCSHSVSFLSPHLVQPRANKEPASPTVMVQRVGSLSRRSLPPGDQAAHLSPSSSLARASVPSGTAAAGREWGPMTPQSSRSLSRAETMMAPSGLRRHSQGSGGGAGPQALQRMYSMPATRGVCVVVDKTAAAKSEGLRGRPSCMYMMC
jgi:hypothetical protein